MERKEEFTQKMGQGLLGIKPPELFKDAIKNLIDFWFC